VEERTGFLRGKLLTEHELAGTATLTARYACRYEIFTPDHLLNQIFKFCNNLLLGKAETPFTKAMLEENAARLAEVSERRVGPGDLARAHLNRLDQEYEPLLAMCRLLVAGYAPGMEIGEVEQLAFVFDMNVLFEEFVAEFLRRHRDRIELDGGRHLVKVERQRVLGRLFNEFGMKVDLILEDNQGERLLVDTKYKVLDPARNHADLSQGDFYQMHAYARAGKEKYREVFLLYPATEDPVEGDFDQDDITLRVRQFDPRKIYDPDTGRLGVDGTIKELGRALSGYIAVCHDIDPCKPWLHKRLPKLFGISIVRC
jgi:5-methylcytosine-specific restriction enzyme subunit McrC